MKFKKGDYVRLTPSHDCLCGVCKELRGRTLRVVSATAQTGVTVETLAGDVAEIRFNSSSFVLCTFLERVDTAARKARKPCSSK